MKALRNIERLEARNLLAGADTDEEPLSDQEILENIAELYLPQENTKFDLGSMHIVYTRPQGPVVHDANFGFQDVKPISFENLYNEYIEKGGSEDYLRSLSAIEAEIQEVEKQNPYTTDKQ
tara:strand:+ start:208 stop:570 length:363 start_codon:yes stop_codon:yes gene_type:complete